MSESPYNLEALAAYVRRPAEKPDRSSRPLPCSEWCSMVDIRAGLPVQSLYTRCTCTEPCQWEQCPADVEIYVPPPVPRFRDAS